MSWILDRRCSSRTADNLYWLARYVERAEYLARILDTTLRLTHVCRSPMSARRNEWESAVATAGCAGAFFAALRRGQRGDRHRFLAFSSQQSLLDPQLLRKRAHQRPRGAHRADHRNVGHHQRRVARTAKNGATVRRRARNSRAFCAGCRNPRCASTARAYRTMLRNDAYWFSRLGVYLERADNTARILDVKFHLLLPAHEQVGGPLDYFQWSVDPALGVGAHRLSLGLSRERQAVARRRPAHPQGRDAAVAGELLREPGAKSRPHRQRLWPPGSGAAPGPRGPGAAREQQASKRFSSTACTNSSAVSSKTITVSAPPSRSNI